MKRVLIIGFDPAVVDYNKFPELNPSQLQVDIDAAVARSTELGYDTKLCPIDLGATAINEVTKVLAATPFDCVLMGAGIRKSDDNFLLFETLINVIHQHAQTARICFDTNPNDAVTAIQRWV